MTDKFRMFGLALLLAGMTMLPLARADEWNKETLVTFSTPVAVPGQVLAPGRYIFKLVDTQSDRHVVQIFTEEPRQIVATVSTIPAYRLQASDENLITFEERPAGTPEAVKRWFYPGDLSGVAFVYPEYQQ